MIDEADKLEIQRLLKLRTANMGDKNSAQDLIRKYISEGAKWCMTCDAAIKQMFGVLRNWAAEQGI